MSRMFTSNEKSRGEGGEERLGERNIRKQSQLVIENGEQFCTPEKRNRSLRADL